MKRFLFSPVSLFVEQIVTISLEISAIVKTVSLAGQERYQHKLI